MRVVITGMGIVSCLGTGLLEVSSSLKAGRSGIVLCPEREEMGFRSPLTGKIGSFDSRMPPVPPWEVGWKAKRSCRFLEKRRRRF